MLYNISVVNLRSQISNCSCKCLLFLFFIFSLMMANYLAKTCFWL